MTTLRSEFDSRTDGLSWERAIAFLVFAAALTLYGLTLAPTVVALFDDSLEFQLVTFQLGIAHPTGYPLYTLLGWLFTRLPIGDVAYRVNLMSAIFGALTAALVYLVILELAPPDHRPWTRISGGLVGALALAVSPVFWSQATVAEVYTLNAAFVAGIMWLLVRPNKRWPAIAFLLGLSLTHHRTMVLLIPAIGFYGWRQLVETGYSRPSRETGIKSALALIAPWLLYLYLPLRGHVGSLDGSYANTLAGFLKHVTAGGYGVFILENPFGTERGLLFYLLLFWDQFGLVGLAAGLVGLAALRRRDALGLSVAFITCVLFNLFYRVADIEVFFIPPFVIWSIWLGVGAGWLLTRLESLRSSDHTWRGWAASVAVVVLAAGQMIFILQHNLPALDRSNDWDVHNYGMDVMSQPLESEAAIVGILGETTLIRYFQATQGLRPDLLPVAADREAERLATVARLLDEGRRVYLTRELPGAADRWSLSAVGPLIQVNPQPITQAPDLPFVVKQSLTPNIVLHGYTVSRPPRHDAPSPLRLTLVWQAIAPPTRDLKVSARLADAQGQWVSQADAVPVHFAYPTTAWRPDELITDVYDLPLAPNLGPGEYTPIIILYDPTQGAAEVGRATLQPVSLP